MTTSIERHWNTQTNNSKTKERITKQQPQNSWQSEEPRVDMLHCIQGVWHILNCNTINMWMRVPHVRQIRPNRGRQLRVQTALFLLLHCRIVAVPDRSLLLGLHWDVCARMLVHSRVHLHPLGAPGLVSRTSARFASTAKTSETASVMQRVQRVVTKIFSKTTAEDSTRDVMITPPALRFCFV